MAPSDTRPGEIDWLVTGVNFLVGLVATVTVQWATGYYFDVSQEIQFGLGLAACIIAMLLAQRVAGLGPPFSTRHPPGRQ